MHSNSTRHGFEVLRTSHRCTTIMSGPVDEKTRPDTHAASTAHPSSFRPLARNVAVVLLACGYLAFRIFSALKQSSGFFVDSETYALCSPKGTARIYTVDVNNSVVECVRVKAERFAETGSLGKDLG